MIIFVAFWIVSFLVSFLVLQAFDRECHTVSNYSIWSNLLTASVPVVNVLIALIALKHLKEKGEDRQ
jgi:hypothetical protein